MFSSRIAKFPVVFSRTPVWLSVAFPCLTLLEMARGGLHIASPTSIYCMDAPVVVLPKGFLPVLATGTGSCSLWVGNLCSQAAIPASFAHRAGVIPHVEKQECAENQSSLWWNAGHELAEFLPSLMPWETMPWQRWICFVILFLMVSSWPFVTQGPL